VQTTLKQTANHFHDFHEPDSNFVLPHFSLFSVVFCQIQKNFSPLSYQLFANFSQFDAKWLPLSSLSNVIFDHLNIFEHSLID
jgi:hypothetical protein